VVLADDCRTPQLRTAPGSGGNRLQLFNALRRGRAHRVPKIPVLLQAQPEVRRHSQHPMAAPATPEPGQVMQRYYGWYASRTRGMRRRQAPAPSGAEAAIAIVEPADWSLRAARFRWAELLRQIFEVDPLRRPQCQGLMRMVAVITDPAVITRILAHRARARDPTHRLRSPPPRRRRSPTPTVAGYPHQQPPIRRRGGRWRARVSPEAAAHRPPDRLADLRADPNCSRATPRSRPGRRVGPRAHHSVPSSGRRKSLSVPYRRVQAPALRRTR
jgi:hypothetical protein